MAVMRSMSKLNIKAPPPSPIPTATGSRSAANEILTDFLEKSLQIPDLTLPETQALRHLGLSDKIDFRSLVSRDRGSLERFLRSARNFGAVVIWQHGIETEEVRETKEEAAKVFEVLEERDTGLIRDSGGKRDEIVWVGCKEERMEWARQYVGAHLYSTFSEKIEKVASKLEEVAEELGKILVENAGKGGKKGVPKRVSHLSIYKYNNNAGDKSADQDQIGGDEDEDEDEENQHCCDYTLSLHLPTKHCQFSAKYGHRLLAFDADPDTIIVTFGQLLEEWSMEDLKCVRGRISYPPQLGGSQFSFSIELKSSSLNITHTYKKPSRKLISLGDQLFIAVIIVCIYSVFMYKKGCA